MTPSSRTDLRTMGKIAALASLTASLQRWTSSESSPAMGGVAVSGERWEAVISCLRTKAGDGDEEE